MKIGTALTSSASKALLLGSGELGKEMTIALQRYGVEVIAVDSYPNAPAQHVAHHSRVIDMTDANAVKRLLINERPHFVIPEIEAIATDALAAVEAQQITKIVPNARAVQLTMNREGIRNLAAKTLGLPTSRYAFATTLAQLQHAIEHAENNIAYPCFVKPIMSSSGKGQSKVKSASELANAWHYAKHGGRTHTDKVIVENAVNFDYEITLLTVRALNQQGQCATYFCKPIGHRQENGDYRESWQPQQMTQKAQHNAQTIAKKITDNIGGLGLFGVELFVKGDDVWFSEVSPRPHDTGMVTMATQRQNQFDLHVRAILGLPVSTRLDKTAASAVILGGVDAKAVEFSGLDNALADAAIDIRLFGKPESFITRRMGVALATADSISDARIKAVEAAQKIKVLPLR